MTQNEKSVVPPRSPTIEGNIYARTNIYVCMFMCVYIYIHMSNFIIVVVPCVLVRLGACCNDKTQWQNPLGKERVYFILQL